MVKVISVKPYGLKMAVEGDVGGSILNVALDKNIHEIIADCGDGISRAIGWW